MLASSWILFALGGLGALDILLFHCIGHGLRKHPDSHKELWSHAARGPIYCFLFLAVPNAAWKGHFFWLLALVLALDLTVSFWDFSMERESRRALGGLSTSEYVLHVLIAITFGALVASIAFEGGRALSEPSTVEWGSTAVPFALRAILAVMAVGTLTSGVLDTRAAWRMRATSLARAAQRAA